MRVFIGTLLGGTLGGELGPFMNYLRKNCVGKIKWVEEKNIHLTYHFLGDLDGKSIGSAREALSGLQFPKIRFSFSEIGFFPGSPKPRVMWLGLGEGKEEIAAMAAFLGEALAEKGFMLMPGFSPHVTLARFKSPSRLAGITEIPGGLRGKKFEISEVSLIGSRLGAGGPAYEKIFNKALK